MKGIFSTFSIFLFQPVDSLDDESKKIVEAAEEARNAFDAAEKAYLGLVDDVKEMESQVMFDYGEGRFRLKSQ